MYELLKDYKPEEVTDDTGVFKGKYDVGVNHARFEAYEGDKPEFKGKEFFRYELQVLEGQKNAGRRLWKSVDPDATDTNAKGKTRIQQLADALFTVGLEFSDKATLEEAAVKFVEMKLRVSCRYFTPKDSDEAIQMHSIIGLAKDPTAEVAKSDSPF